jgi:hypothetical protein
VKEPFNLCCLPLLIYLQDKAVRGDETSVEAFRAISHTFSSASFVFVQERYADSILNSMDEVRTLNTAVKKLYEDGLYLGHMRVLCVYIF